MNKEKIIAFLDGQLISSEQKAITQKILTDVKFAAEVDKVKENWEIQTMMGHAALKEQMAQWETVEKEEDLSLSSKKNWKNALSKEAIFLEELKQKGKAQSTKKRSGKTEIVPIWKKIVRPLSMAASFLLVILAGIFFWSTNTISNQALFDEYYNAKIMTTGRGGAVTNKNIETIEQLFYQGNTQIAIENATKLLPTLSEVEQFNVNYIIAQAYQQQQDYPNAIRYFEAMEKTEVQNIKIKIQQNIIALHILNNDEEQAINKIKTIQAQELSARNADEKAQLNTLMRQLEHPLRTWFAQ